MSRGGRGEPGTDRDQAAEPPGGQFRLVPDPDGQAAVGGQFPSLLGKPLRALVLGGGVREITGEHGRPGHHPCSGQRCRAGPGTGLGHDHQACERPLLGRFTDLELVRGEQGALREGREVTGHARDHRGTALAPAGQRSPGPAQCRGRHVAHPVQEQFPDTFAQPDRRGDDLAGLALGLVQRKDLVQREGEVRGHLRLRGHRTGKERNGQEFGVDRQCYLGEHAIGTTELGLDWQVSPCSAVGKSLD
jgi:hypothetical protein